MMSIEEDGGEHAALDDEGYGPRDEFPRSSACGSMKEKMRPWTQSTSPMQFGPQRRMPVRAAISAEPVLQALPLRAGFGEAARFDHDAADPLRGALLDRRGHQRGGDEDDGEVHRAGDGADGGITGQAFDLAGISGLTG